MEKGKLLRTKLKIKIFTEGGPDIGLGHISRCSALYDEIIDRGISVEFYIFGEINNTKIANGENVYNVNWLTKEFLNDNITKNDSCIVDSYLASVDLYEIVASKAKKALYIDDTGRLHYPKGIVVNPSLNANKIKYHEDTNVRYLMGSEYVILRKPFIGAFREGVNKDAKRVLVTMGGTDMRNLTPLIIREICSIHPELQFDIVAGEAFDKTEKLGLENVNFHFNVNANEMKELMLNADFAISAAGQTIYELIATQTPFIAIKIAENQENNIIQMQNSIPGQVFIDCHAPDFIKSVSSAMALYGDINVRNNLFKNYGKLIDRKGAERIVDQLTNHELCAEEIQLRRAKTEDMQDVFELSNEDRVRHFSIQKEKIKWDDHVNWYSQAINDKNFVFYIVTNNRGEFLGQIRYELSKNTAVISISLSSKIIGRGLSKDIAKSSLTKLAEEKKEIDTIVALVSLNNLVSKKLFQSLGFIEVGIEDGLYKFELRIRE